MGDQSDAYKKTAICESQERSGKDQVIVLLFTLLKRPIGEYFTASGAFVLQAPQR